MFTLIFRELTALYKNDIYEMQRKCDIDNWYEDLKDYTAKTYFIRLSEEQAMALSDLSYDFIQNNRKFEEIVSDIKIKTIYKKIKAIVNKFPNGFFVRLNSRSPKDSELIMKQGIDRLKKIKKFEPGNLNDKLISKLEARFLGLRLKTAKDCLQVLLDSRRIRNDLEELISFGDLPTIVIREFLDINPLTELRVFVKDRRIVAITQYNYLIISEDLIQNKEKYLNIVYSLFDKIKGKILLNDYIFDIGFLNNNNNNKGNLKPVVIELNPYSIGTSACLFSWREDFQMGKTVPKEVEFRIRTEYLKEEDNYS